MALPFVYLAGAAALSAAGVTAWWLSPKSKIPELKIAVFGESGSGKTTLLTSYYGNQQRNSFEEKFGYRLEAEDTADRKRLLSHYHKMESGDFPLGTEDFAEYGFGLKFGALPKPGIKITWSDYPGGWWERDPEDPDEETLRMTAFGKLLGCHCGFLIVDGERFKDEGMKYVKTLLDSFKGTMLKTRGHFDEQGKKIEEVLPKQWILAISKADTLPPGTTAQSIGVSISQDAREELDGIRRAGKLTNFGDKCLLLSAVRGQGSQVVDPHEHSGLQLIAPLAFLSFLDEVATTAKADSKYRHANSLADWVKQLEQILSKIALPKQFVPFGLLLLKMAAAVGYTAEHFREKQKEATDALEAAAMAMSAELAEPAAKTLYYSNPG